MYEKRYWVIPHAHACGYPICDSQEGKLIGYADTPEDAELIVDALNAYEEDDVAS